MTEHERYEVLCTLAATRQLAGPEKANFEDHCIQCPACRRQLQDLLSIGSHLQFDAAIHANSAPMPAGSFERFRTRAIQEGIALRSPPARPSPWYALASVAAVFVIVAVLVLMPDRRNAPGHLEMSAQASVPIRQGFPASVTGRQSAPQPSRAVHARFVRHKPVPHTGTGGNEAGGATQQFPRVLTAGYSFFGPESVMKPLPAGYPALSRSQISQLSLFPKLGDSSSPNVASLGTPNRPVDIASIGKVFDFATNIRQIHFQRPTAQ